MSRGRTVLLATLTFAGCTEPEGPDPDRMRGDQKGAILLSTSGLLPADRGWASGDVLNPGTMFSSIVHPVDESGSAQPARMVLHLEMGTDGDDENPVRGAPDAEDFVFIIRFHPKDDVPLVTRTLFTEHIGSATALLQVPGAAAESDPDPWVYTGDVDVDLLAADLATGAAWGRFTVVLTREERPGEAWPVSAEFAAWMDTDCVWIMDPTDEPTQSGSPYSSRAPEGRADECLSTIEAIAGLPADPGAPPVPFRYPPLDPAEIERWSGLDGG